MTTFVAIMATGGVLWLITIGVLAASSLIEPWVDEDDIDEALSWLVVVGAMLIVTGFIGWMVT
jgi:hypothetical protein